MARTVYQFQIGQDFFQVLREEYDPLFNAKEVVGRLRLIEYGTSFQTMLELGEASDSATAYYGIYSPDRILLCKTKPASFVGTPNETFFLVDLAGVVSGSLIGAFLGLYTEYSGSRALFAYFHPGDVSSSWPPMLRLPDCALIIDNVPAIAAQIISGMANIYWDNTNKRLDGRDSGGVDYPLGYNDRGNPSAVDKTQANLTLDATWRDLDLSAIVPAGAKSIALAIRVKDGSAGQLLRFRKNGLSNAINVATISTQVANLDNYADLIVACDSGRVIEYYGTANTDEIDITVKGWWI